VLGWSECGHHIVAAIAYDILEPPQQTQVIRILKEHPNFEKDFAIPPGIDDVERFIIGSAGYWPDIARRYEKWNRPTWHYELGSTMTIG
jgi:hypothetical protein